MTTAIIRVDEETNKFLARCKAALKLKSADDVIRFLEHSHASRRGADWLEKLEKRVED